MREKYYFRVILFWERLCVGMSITYELNLCSITNLRYYGYMSFEPRSRLAVSPFYLKTKISSK
jgi:hypothetical protein